MKKHAPFVVAICFAFLGLALTCASRAYADGSGSGSGSAEAHVQPPTVVAPGLGSATPVAPAPTAATLSDPTANPVAAYHELVSFKGRWPLLVFAVLVMLAKLAHYVGDKFGVIGKWLAVGRRAMVIAAVGGIASACFDSVASGGTWTGTLLVAGAALLALLTPHGTDTGAK